MCGHYRLDAPLLVRAATDQEYYPGLRCAPSAATRRRDFPQRLRPRSRTSRWVVTPDGSGGYLSTPPSDPASMCFRRLSGRMSVHTLSM